MGYVVLKIDEKLACDWSPNHSVNTPSEIKSSFGLLLTKLILDHK